MIKLKKIVALLLITAICFSLSACGDNTMTKDEMLAIAEEYSASDIQSDSLNNIVSAKQKYCNKTISISGAVRKIKENFIELSAGYASNYIIDVYLSAEELVTLKEGQVITIVGTTTDEIIEASESVAQYSLNYSHYQMPTAYLVKDKVDITGILIGVNSSFAPAFNIEIGNSNKWDLIYFADDIDTSTLEFNKKITVSAKAIYTNSSLKYHEAEIIE